MREHFFWLTEEQFARIEPLLPTDTRDRPRVDDRRVISGIIHVLKSGGGWGEGGGTLGGRWVDAPLVEKGGAHSRNRPLLWQSNHQDTCPDRPLLLPRAPGGSRRSQIRLKTHRRQVKEQSLSNNRVGINRTQQSDQLTVWRQPRSTRKEKGFDKW